MTVIIAQNLKKERLQVDAGGNTFDPKTKEYKGPVEEPSYSPTQEERAVIEEKGQKNTLTNIEPAKAAELVAQGKATYIPHMSTGSSELDAKIEEKVEAYRKQLIEKAKEALDNL